MADYTSVVKLESLHSLEITEGTPETSNIGNFPSFGALKGGYVPATVFKYFKDARHGAGQIYPRSL